MRNIPEPCLCGDPYCKRCFPDGADEPPMKECPSCEGTGKHNDPELSVCMNCDGSGEVEWSADDYHKAEEDAQAEAAYWRERDKEPL